MRLHVLLGREGWKVNQKLIYRLYGEEGLILRRKRPRRRKSAVVRMERPEAKGPGERWAMDHWAYWNQVGLDFSRRGKPTDNAVAESFLASLRRECLTLHWFRDLEEARDQLAQWRDDYNNVRPHSSLGDLPPAHFGAGGHLTPGPERLQIQPFEWTRFGGNRKPAQV